MIYYAAKIPRHLQRRKYLVFFIILFVTQFSYSQTDSSKAHILFPKPVNAGKFYSSLGASITVIPRLIVEEGVIQLPILDARAKYGITDEFYLSGRANIVYITNQISLGAAGHIHIKTSPFLLQITLVIGLALLTFKDLMPRLWDWQIIQQLLSVLLLTI